MIVSVRGERWAYLDGLAYFEEDLGEAMRWGCGFFGVEVRVAVERRRFWGDVTGECRFLPIFVLSLVCIRRGLLRVTIAALSSALLYLNLSRPSPNVGAMLEILVSCSSSSVSDN